ACRYRCIINAANQGGQLCNPQSLHDQGGVRPASSEGLPVCYAAGLGADCTDFSGRCASIAAISDRSSRGCTLRKLSSSLPLSLVATTGGVPRRSAVASCSTERPIGVKANEMEGNS